MWWLVLGIPQACTAIGRQLVFGYFNYYLGHGYAVDEDLYKTIVDLANTQSTASIAQRLKRLQYGEYLDQYQLYLGAVGLDKVKPQRKKQQTITSMFPKLSGDPELDRLLKERKAKQKMDAGRLRLLMNCAHNRHAMDITLRSIILKDKDNHNIHGGQLNTIPGLGGTKLRKLISCNILSTKLCWRQIQWSTWLTILSICSHDGNEWSNPTMRL
jgi:hypothetical protein